MEHDRAKTETCDYYYVKWMTTKKLMVRFSLFEMSIVRLSLKPDTAMQ